MPESFLFSVRCPTGDCLGVFPIKNKEGAIYCAGDPGPSFGDSYDLDIANDCNANTGSCSKLGDSYRNDTGRNGDQVLAGECNFQVKEIEVFWVAV
jgi:hypothetical protein